jgi:hypothetical protein
MKLTGNTNTLLAVAAAGLLLFPMPDRNAARAAEAAADACPAGSNQPLAFWFGRWDVYADGKLDGRNFVESALGGCAVIEYWDDASGSRGMSLFYFEPHQRQWKQVWVTNHALAPGGLKEKTMIYATADRVRFQGIVWAAPDRMILDRTTLSKVDGGRVAQVIELSRDGGSTWTKAFDAIYRPATASPKQAPAAPHANKD